MGCAAYLEDEEVRSLTARTLNKGTIFRMSAYTIQKVTRTLKVALFLCVAAVWPLAAQTPVFDTSGNGMLNGTYYFRHVYYLIDTTEDSSGIIGDVSDAIAVYGSITFSGNGTYTFNNALVNDYGQSVTAYPLSCYLAGTAGCSSTSGTPVTSTYSLSASGFGFLVDPVTQGDYVYGLVAANGIFSGSSTESEVAGEYGDLFIAAPLPSPQPTGFSGSYNVVGYSPGQDLSFQINPSGGNLGTVNISGYYEGGGTSTESQSSNVTYTFSNGAAVLAFPNSNTANFFSGPEYLYFSPDLNFFFGGSPNGYDMILGVNNTSSDQSFGVCNGGSSCLYYQAGIDQDLGELGSGYADFDGYYGSLNATSAGNIIAHERVADQIFDASSYGYTFSDTFTPPVTGAYNDAGFQFNYWVGDGGTVRIGEGIGPYLGITVAFQAPNFTTPSGPVYINPTGIVNAASFSPFTSGVANGEFITLFGNNLAPGTLVASGVPYPTTLNGVQVMINNVAAPLYFVTPGQIAAIVPSQNPYDLANIQVINNGVSSNVVSELVNPTVPGVYTNPSGGVYAAAVDTNTGQIVTPSTPANPGDTIEVFATGLGTAYPPVADGAAPPDSPLSYTVNTILADLDYGATPLTVGFAGLAPTLAGLYQINVTLPSTTTAGDHALDISGTYPTGEMLLQSYEQQVLISVSGGLARPAERTVRRHARSANASGVQRNRRCFFKCDAQPQRVLPLPSAKVSAP
jgi:uncharacterized protein (TIGR03437 family)